MSTERIYAPAGSSMPYGVGLPSRWGAQSMPAPMGGRSTSLEKIYIAILGIASISSYFLYKADYMYVGISLFGLPFLIGCLLDPRVGIYAYWFWQAWDSAVVLGEGKFMTIGKILAFVVLGTCLLHIFRRPIVVKNSRSLLGWSLAFCIVAFLSCTWSYDVLRAIRMSFQMFVQLLLVIIMVVIAGSDLETIKRIALWALLGGTTAGMYVLLYGMDQSAYGRATLGDSANPASVAAALTVALSSAPMVWLFSKSRLLKGLIVASACIILCAIIGTGTRAALGGVLITCVVAGVLAGGQGRAKRLLVMIVVLVMFYVVGAIAIYSNMVPEQSSVRLAEFMHLPSPKEGSRQEGQAHGREHTWELAMKGYQAAGILGSGVSNSGNATFDAIGIVKDVHSNLLGALVEMGPLGLIVFIGIHVVLFIKVLKLRLASLQILAWFSFLPSTILGLTHTTYTSKWFWLPLALACMCFEMNPSSHWVDDRRMVSPINRTNVPEMPT